MNDEDRQQWVDNDEGLYREQQRAPNKRKWLRENRARIDSIAAGIVNGTIESDTHRPLRHKIGL